MNAKKIDKLAKEIRSFLLENEMWSDVAIFFNGKEFTTETEDGRFYYNDPDHLVVIEDRDPHDYTDYAGDILTMTFEGPLYEALNYGNGKVEEKLTEIFNKYGLYYEMGEAWNLTAYEINPPKKKVKESTIKATELLYGVSYTSDKTLKEIMQHWYEKSEEYGDIGSCVIGAKLCFDYKGTHYEMFPQSPWQGSCSWESGLPEIEEMLRSAGATEIYYNPGQMD